MKLSLTNRKLLISTHNQGKFDEISILFRPFSCLLVSAKELGLNEPEEIGCTFLENAKIKAHAGALASGFPTLADDSGLEVEALGGAPGVYTADWAETPSGRDFTKAMEEVHKQLEIKKVPHPRLARFTCTLVLAFPNGVENFYVGSVEGKVVWPMRGNQGHGYDPIFVPKGHTETFGEMNRWEKNKISHRAKAMEKFFESNFS